LEALPPRLLLLPLNQLIRRIESLQIHGAGLQFGW
jgi:hypothetical protein